MMRDIKFRAKSMKTNEWVYGAYRYHEPTNTHNIFVCYFDSELGGFEEHDYEVISESVSQFTGRKDRNGTDIYEGDKLKHEDGTIIEVFFDKGEFKVKYLVFNDMCYDYISLVGSSVLVGNKYDNPKLLGERN